MKVSEEKSMRDLNLCPEADLSAITVRVRPRSIHILRTPSAPRLVRLPQCRMLGEALYHRLLAGQTVTTPDAIYERTDVGML